MRILKHQKKYFEINCKLIVLFPPLSVFEVTPSSYTVMIEVLST